VLFSFHLTNYNLYFFTKIKERFDTVSEKEFVSQIQNEKNQHDQKGMKFSDENNCMQIELFDR
jgi:hypothetical protein